MSCLYLNETAKIISAAPMYISEQKAKSDLRFKDIYVITLKSTGSGFESGIEKGAEFSSFFPDEPSNHFYYTYRCAKSGRPTTV
jgi:hypothetical protein